MLEQVASIQIVPSQICNTIIIQVDRPKQYIIHHILILRIQAHTEPTHQTVTITITFQLVIRRNMRTEVINQAT